jgi:hypothetical protein
VRLLKLNIWLLQVAVEVHHEAAQVAAAQVDLELVLD